MKIMLVGSDAGVSGAGYSMIKLADELEKMGVSVVRVVRKGNTYHILRNQGIKCYVVNAQSWILPLGTHGIKKILKVLAKKVINFFCYFQYCLIIKKEKPDIIHINAITTYVAAKAALRYKIPIVWHIRELLEEDLGGEFWDKGEAFDLISKANYLIAISDCVKQKYETFLPQNKIVRIYNGIDMNDFYLPGHNILTSKTVNITMAGRITCKKGQYETLISMKNILKRDSNIILRFVGTGTKDELSRLEEYITLNNINPKQVLFTGYVSDMRSVWNETDISIVYSKCEAFGRVTVEAMAAGVLVLGYNTGATKELIQNGRNGYLFEDEGRYNLENTLGYCLKNRDEAREVAETARKESKEIYTSQHNAEEVKKIYEMILNN